MPRALVLLGPLAAALVPAAAVPGAPPCTSGEQGLERRFASELELATESFEMTATEGERTLQQEGPRYVREQADEIEIEETFAQDEDPADPDTFERLYRSITSSLRMGPADAPQDRMASAALAGKSVRFEREDDGSWSRRCEDGDARPGQLKRLRAELSLRTFLPPEEVEEGDTWEPEASALLRLVSPLEAGVHRGPKARARGGGRGLDVAPSALAEPLGALLDGLDGSLEATRLEDAEDEDLPCQARLEFRLTSSFDGSQRLTRENERETASEDEVEATWRGSGTLAWDPASGRIELTCQGELRLSESFRIGIEANGAEGTVQGELEVVGTLEVEGVEGPR